MSQWYMLTVVGEDQPGIVAKITKTLFDAQANLGEASMIRLGGNFTVMLMVSTDKSRDQLEATVKPVTDAMRLRLHLDPIEGHLHDHRVPDVSISVFGSDRAGIVAEVTGALTEAGLEILDLDSDVGGSKDKPLYIMQIDGLATQGVEALQKAIEKSSVADVDVRIQPIDTLVG